MKSSMLSSRAKPGTELQMERERSGEFLRCHFVKIKIVKLRGKSSDLPLKKSLANYFPFRQHSRGITFFDHVLILCRQVDKRKYKDDLLT